MLRRQLELLKQRQDEQAARADAAEGDCCQMKNRRIIELSVPSPGSLAASGRIDQLSAALTIQQ